MDVYVRIYQLYQQGKTEESKELFYRFIPYLTFAMQHLELAVGIEKRVLVKRGIFPSARMRRPTLFYDDAYEAQMDELVTRVVALAEECQRM